MPWRKNGRAPEELLLFYSLFHQVLSDANTSLEHAVCFLPTNTSDLPKNYHGENASDYCDIFDEEKEDWRGNTSVPDRPVHESTPRKKLVLKPH